AVPPPRRNARRSGEIQCDEALFNELRQVRRRLAEERGVPAYIICGDVTLRELARDLPVDRAAMAHITGLGAKKLADFGDVFARHIARYRAAQSFNPPSAPSAPATS